MKIIQSFVRLKNALLYKCGVHSPYSKVRIWAMRKLGYTIGKHVYFPADIVVSMTFVDNKGKVVIGDRVSFGPRVTLLPVMHANFSKYRECFENNNSHKDGIIIGDDSWIGAGVIILNGITIGEGSIVGAGAVVTKDVPPNAVVAGNPARILRVNNI